MMRKALSMILAAVLMVSVAGCGGTKTAKETGTDIQAAHSEEVSRVTESPDAPKEDGAKKLKMGLSLVTLNFPYYVRMYEQFMSEAEAKGWEVSFVDGNLDAATQLNGIQDMINNDVDVMVVATWYIDAMEDVFAQCKEKGIPIFIVGSTENPDAINDMAVYACGTENYDAGFLGGTWASQYFNKEGKRSIKMAIMSGSTEQMKKRGMGVVDGLKEGGIEVEVLNEYDVSTREDAMASAEDALTAYSEVDLFFGASAQDSLGAYDATAGANRTQVLVMGYDGEDEELELIDEGTNYIATVTQNPAQEATTTVEYISKYVNGESFDKIVPIPAGIYSAQGQLTSAQVLGK